MLLSQFIHRSNSNLHTVYKTSLFVVSANIDDVVLPFGLYHAISQQNLKKGSLRLNTPACGGEPTPRIPTMNVNRRLMELGSNPIIIGTGSTEFGSGFMSSYGIENRCNETENTTKAAKKAAEKTKQAGQFIWRHKKGFAIAAALFLMLAFFLNGLGHQSFRLGCWQAGRAGALQYHYPRILRQHEDDEYGWFKLDKLMEYVEELAEKEHEE